MAGGLFLFPPEAAATYSTLAAWPVGPLAAWGIGRYLYYRVHSRGAGAGSAVASFLLRSIGLGVLFAPTIAGNEVVAFILPAAWILIWRVTTQPNGQLPDDGTLQISWFIVALFCGLSIVVHATLDRARSKRRN